MRHCPNCDGEVIVWDADLMADKCLDCGESWTLEEQEIATAPAQSKKWAAADAAIRAVIRGAEKTTADRYIVDGPAMRELANLLIG